MLLSLVFFSEYNCTLQCKEKIQNMIVVGSIAGFDNLLIFGMATFQRISQIANETKMKKEATYQATQCIVATRLTTSCLVTATKSFFLSSDQMSQAVPLCKD
jgi:hypothetical protein